MEFTLESISKAVSGTLTGDPNKIIKNALPFEYAGEDAITFAGGPKFLKRLKEKPIGAVLVPSYFSEEGGDYIRVDNPQIAFNHVVRMFYPAPAPKDDISPYAIVGKNLKRGEKLTIHPTAVIGDNVTVGNRVFIYPGVVIGNNVTIGDDVRLCANVCVGNNCVIGNRVTINAGTVIGSDGFGFAPNGLTYEKIPHRGIVRIEDDVELGALNAIDRGTMGETLIKRGVKTDNLVHIAHNVIIGENTLLVAQVGIAGSTEIGNQVVLAGQVGVSGHLKIGDHTIIGPKSGVAKSHPGNDVLSGIPVMPHKTWLKTSNIIPKLPEMNKKIRELEKRLEQLESGKT